MGRTKLAAAGLMPCNDLRQINELCLGSAQWRQPVRAALETVGCYHNRRHAPTPAEARK